MKRLLITGLLITGLTGLLAVVPFGFWQSYRGTRDNMESYTNAALVNALNGGIGFSGPYSDRGNPFGLVSLDDVDHATYTSGLEINGLNEGRAWGSAYADRVNPLGAYSADSMASYADGAAVNGLNSGETNWRATGRVVGWGGPYSDR